MFQFECDFDTFSSPFPYITKKASEFTLLDFRPLCIGHRDDVLSDKLS